MAMRHTEWRKISPTERMRVQYGLNQHGGQEPYFSITGEKQRGRGSVWKSYSFGQLHGDIRRHFPELADLIKWHLVDVSSGPMHYLANAETWRRDAEIGVPNALKYFKSTIIYGEVPGDEEDDHDLADAGATRAWLEARLPVLMRRFHEDMKRHGAE